jgi:peroxiredoxin
MTIKVGDKMPEGQFTVMTGEGPKPLGTDELFGGKKVVLFGLPGAFTPTCSAQHLPGYLQNADALKAKGVDAIACMSVNDPFVMGAWGKDQSVGDSVTLLADGSADYTAKLGLGLDLTERGLGQRCTRFSMLVENGEVKALNVEENPGEAQSSSAETMLGQV